MNSKTNTSDHLLEINYIESIQRRIDEKLDALPIGKSPVSLYEPIRYILNLGGKRLRPLLVLLSYKLFDEKNIESVYLPALAVEVFHNFTLMHDDIMDLAPIRRGNPTVHMKWGVNNAILSGDVMLVAAYDMLLSVEEKLLKEVLTRFNQTAKDVCEGQQLDMLFEKEQKVSEQDYLNMIKLKTASLLAFSLELGAILGGASHDLIQKLYLFGIKVGIGFQLKDDLLDVFSDQSKFGKQTGGDIVTNKKTYLLIKALEIARGSTKQELETWLLKKEFDKKDKILAVSTIYKELGIDKLTEAKVSQYFEEAFDIFNSLDTTYDKKILTRLIQKLISREQ